MGAAGHRVRRKRKRRSPPADAWSVRYAIGALLVVVLLAIVEGLVLWFVLPRGPLRTGVGGILLDLTILSMLIPLYRRRPFRPRDLGLRRASPATSVGWVFLAVVAIGLTNLLWMQKVLGLKSPDSLGITLRGGTVGLALTGVFMALLAPVTEEIFFRGVIYRSLRNRLSVPSAALIAGLLFALIHGLSFPLETLPPRLVFGVIACLLYERTGSLLPAIALHCLVDAGAYETALTGHDRIVLPAFAALGLVLLLYAAVNLHRGPGRLGAAPTHPSRT